jgi:predicted ribosomally synthesized peptide with SipW-like signal peptide
MKKILGLSVAVLAIVGLVVGATLAFFSDTETTPENTFTAGVVDITISEASNVVTANDLITDLKPCMYGYKIINITAAAGANPMELWKRVDVGTASTGITVYPDSENGPVSSEPEYLAEGATWDGSAWDVTAWVTKDDIDRYIHFLCFIDGLADSALGTVAFDPGNDTWIVEESEGFLLSNNADDTTGFVPAAAAVPNGIDTLYFYLGIIDGNEADTTYPSSIQVVQGFHMDAIVGNWAQGDDLTLTETIVAQQIEGSVLPPLPGTTLQSVYQVAYELIRGTIGG